MFTTLMGDEVEPRRMFIEAERAVREEPRHLTGDRSLAERLDAWSAAQSRPAIVESIVDASRAGEHHADRSASDEDHVFEAGGHDEPVLQMDEANPRMSSAMPSAASLASRPTMGVHSREQPEQCDERTGGRPGLVWRARKGPGDACEPEDEQFSITVGEKGHAEHDAADQTGRANARCAAGRGMRRP